MERCERTSLRREEPVLQLVRDIAIGHAAAWQYVNPKAAAGSMWSSNQIKGKDAYGDVFKIGIALDRSDEHHQILRGAFKAGEYAREALKMCNLDWRLVVPLSYRDSATHDTPFHEGAATAIIYQEKHPEAWPIRRFINRLLRKDASEQVYRAWQHLADGGICFREEYDLPEDGAERALEQALGRVAHTLRFLNTQLQEGLLHRDDLHVTSIQSQYNAWINGGKDGRTTSKN